MPKLTKSIKPTQLTPDIIGLIEEIQESLQAGRIDFEAVSTIKEIIDRSGNEHGLAALRYLEKLKYIEAYYESLPYGFKLHELTFGCQVTSPEERHKVAITLREALEMLKFYSGLERDPK
jgi:hypothetical protein